MLLRNFNNNNIARFKHKMTLLVRMQYSNLMHYLGARSKAHFVVITELAKDTIPYRKFLEQNTLSHVHASHIAKQVALDMASLHEEEVTVIHCELSLECILINSKTMEARVADLGL